MFLPVQGSKRMWGHLLAGASVAALAKWEQEAQHLLDNRIPDNLTRNCIFML